MAVDDVAVGPLQAELPQQPVADLRVVVVGIVGVFGLGPGRLVLDEPPFKGGHPVPPEGGRVAPGPKEPQEILAQNALGRARFGIVALTGHPLGVVQKGPAPQVPAADGEGLELAVGGEGDAAVEQQVAVAHLIQPALGVQEPDMALELLAALEGGGELSDEL